MSSGPVERLATEVTERPKRLLGVVALLTLVAATMAAQIRLDIDLLAVFDTKGPERELADEFAATFDSNWGTVVAVVRPVGAEDGAPATEATIAALAELTDEAAAIPGIARVVSVTSIPVVRPPGVGDPSFSYAPVFAPDLDALSVDDRIALARRGRLGSSQLVSEDGSVFLVIGIMDAELVSYDDRSEPAEAFRDQLTLAADRQSEVITADFAGLHFTTMETVEQTRDDMLVLLPIAVLAMIGITLVFFRSLWAVAAAVAAIVASVVVTLGVMWLRGDDLNQFTSAFPVLLIGVTVATGTHLIHRYFTERGRGAEPAEAARATVNSVAGVSLLCSATNALGFLSLLVASMPILREFGLYLAIGVGFSFLFTATVIPAVLQLVDASPPAYYRRSADEGSTDSAIDRMTARYASAMATPATAIAVTGLGFVLVAMGFAGGRSAVFDYSVSREFPSDSTITEANQLVDTKLGGSIPVEVSLRGAPGAWLEPSNLRLLGEFDTYLRSEEGLDTLGIPSLVVEMERLGFPLPEDAAGVEAAIEVLLEQDEAAEQSVSQIVSDDRSWTRITSLRPEDGANAYLAMIDRVEGKAGEIFAGTDIEVEVTGEAAVSFLGVDQLTGELVGALSLAVAMIVGAIALAFRSISVAAITLLPNAIPLSIGFAGYLALYETADPLMAGVFVIVLGIAADDTVHLTNRYLALIGEGVPSGRAVVQAFTDLRRAMISSTVVLVSAFAVLLSASMPSTQLIGRLGGSLLLLALLSDLVFGLAGISLLAGWHHRYGIPDRHRRIAISPAERSFDHEAFDPNEDLLHGLDRYVGAAKGGPEA